PGKRASWMNAETWTLEMLKAMSPRLRRLTVSLMLAPCTSRVRDSSTCSSLWDSVERAYSSCVARVDSRVNAELHCPVYPVSTLNLPDAPKSTLAFQPSSTPALTENCWVLLSVLL